MKIDRTKARRWIIVVFVMGIFGIFVARLISVQVVQADSIRQRLEAVQVHNQTVKAVRGEIVDRNGVSLVSNTLGYDVIVDKVAFPRSTQNEVILDLIELFEQSGAEWIDNLPITREPPFTFLERYESDVRTLKNTLKIHQYASVEDAMFHLTERYGLEEFSETDARKIAGVRYEMERRDFAIDILYTFATDIDIDLVLKIKEQSYRLPGVDIQESAIRNYDRGDIAPHLIGQTGPIFAEEWTELQKKGYAMDDILGKSGAEAAFEDILRGENGKRQISLDHNGRVVGADITDPSEPGKTVYLSIDAEMQDLLQKALEAQIKRLQQTAEPGKGREATYGAAVVINNKTGEVLACATYPSYNLNTFYADYDQLVADTDGRPLLNRALQGLYAPGSTFKPVVATAGLANGYATPESTVFCGKVYTRFQGYRPTCLGSHGNIDVNRALSLSCNIYFYDVGYNAGIDLIDKTAKQFGLGEATGIELYEYTGQRSNPETFEATRPGEKWSEGNVVQTAIGQLVAQYTPLQLANYAATIANRGERMELTFVKEVRDYAREKVVEPHNPVVADRVEASRADFETVVAGMVSASRTGSAAAHFGTYPFDVASKTGTPEAVMDSLNSTFICFAPAQDPELAIAVVIEKGYHGYTSAPVARAIFDDYFGVYNPNPLVPKETADDQPSDAQRIESASGVSADSAPEAGEPTEEQPGEEESPEQPDEAPREQSQGQNEWADSVNNG